MTCPGVGAGRTQAVGWLPGAQLGAGHSEDSCAGCPLGSRPSRLVQRLRLGQLAGLYCFTPLWPSKPPGPGADRRSVRGRWASVHPAPGLASRETVPSQDEATGWSQQHSTTLHVLSRPLVPNLPCQPRRRVGDKLMSATPCPSCGGGDMGATAKREGLKHLRPAGERGTAVPGKQGQWDRRQGQHPLGPRRGLSACVSA